jgi:hypothetical protein
LFSLPEKTSPLPFNLAESKIRIPQTVFEGRGIVLESEDDYSTMAHSLSSHDNTDLLRDTEPDFESTSNYDSLSKSLIETEKRQEKEKIAKKTGLSKAFKDFRLVLGGVGSGSAPFSSGPGDSKVKIPLGIFGEGRLTLPPGRKGEIIPVHEDELSTIIAYSLATEEYYIKLQEFLGGEVDPDFEYNATHDGGWGAPYTGSRGERTGTEIY